MKTRGAGFQKRLSLPKSKTGGLGIVSTEGDRSTCRCGWGYEHQREKVREDAVDRHFIKRHSGRGIRL